MAGLENGVSLSELHQLIGNFYTEISIAKDSANTESKKKVIKLYEGAYEDYQVGYDVANNIIRYDLENYVYRENIGVSNRVIKALKPILAKYNMQLTRQLNGKIYDLKMVEVSKIWNVAQHKINEANEVIRGE